jgi:CRP-like cAMP-binding protein
LNKLTYYFKRRTYNRNQLLFVEGEPCKSVYVVLNGEIEIIKKIKPKKKAQIDYDVFIGPQPVQPDKLSDALISGNEKGTTFHVQQKSGEKSRTQAMAVHLENMHNTMSKPHHMSIVGKGNMVADEDAIYMRAHSTSGKCESMTAEILEMSLVDFHTRVKPIEDTWRYIVMSS